MTAELNQFGAATTAGWLTAVEAAQYLKVRVRTLLLWVRQGKVKAFALSGTKRRVWRCICLAHAALSLETRCMCSPTQTDMYG